MRSKLDQARELLHRRRARIESWADTTRNLAILVAENREAVIERDAIASKPLGYVHGILERIRQEIGADAVLTLTLDGSRKLLLTVTTPRGIGKMTMEDSDYDIDADALAEGVASVCQKRGVMSHQGEG